METRKPPRWAFIEPGGESSLLEIPEHCRAPLVAYILHGEPVGDFLTALLSNDLRETFGRADHINIHHVYDYVHFLYNYAPGPCWGSPEKVQAWLEKHAEERDR